MSVVPAPVQVAGFLIRHSPPPEPVLRNLRGRLGVHQLSALPHKLRATSKKLGTRMFQRKQAYLAYSTRMSVCLDS